MFVIFLFTETNMQCMKKTNKLLQIQTCNRDMKQDDIPLSISLEERSPRPAFSYHVKPESD